MDKLLIQIKIILRNKFNPLSHFKFRFPLTFNWVLIQSFTIYILIWFWIYDFDFEILKGKNKEVRLKKYLLNFYILKMKIDFEYKWK